MRTKDRMVEVNKAKNQPEFMCHFYDGYVWSGRVGKEKNRFQDAYPDSFRRLFNLRSLSLRFYAAKFFANVSDFVFFFRQGTRNFSASR